MNDKPKEELDEEAKRKREAKEPGGEPLTAVPDHDISGNPEQVEELAKEEELSETDPSAQD